MLSKLKGNREKAFKVWKGSIGVSIIVLIVSIFGACVLGSYICVAICGGTLINIVAYMLLGMDKCNNKFKS